jgi:hypothetical protein
VRDALLHVSDHGTPPDEATPDGTIPYCFNFLTQRGPHEHMAACGRYRFGRYYFVYATHFCERFE